MTARQQLGARLFVLGGAMSFTALLLILLGVDMDYLFLNIIRLTVIQHAILWVMIPAVLSVMGFRMLFGKS